MWILPLFTKNNYFWRKSIDCFCSFPSVWNVGQECFTADQKWQNCCYLYYHWTFFNGINRFWPPTKSQPSLNRSCSCHSGLILSTSNKLFWVLLFLKSLLLISDLYLEDTQIAEWLLWEKYLETWVFLVLLKCCYLLIILSSV